MVKLTWEGKYNAGGKRTSSLRLQLPFQTVEMVNESAQERQMALDLFSAGSTGHSTSPLVSLILGLKDPGLWHLSRTLSRTTVRGDSTGRQYGATVRGDKYGAQGLEIQDQGDQGPVEGIDDQSHAVG